ncbi:MAG: 3-hydroxyacyl-CoA dehydrogenase/enoyl-CoA hydratase family protein [Thermoplasmataceae archaeon]
MDIRKITVIGAGIMGSGIAQVIAAAGIDVVIEDAYSEALDKSGKTISDSLARLVKSGKITESDSKSILSRVGFSSDLREAVSDSDIIIEAVPEIPDLKKKIFADVEKVARPDSVLATNTSNIRISEIAEGLKNPGRLVGMHFFNPPVIMKLVEVIKGEHTNDESFETIYNLVKKIGKTPIKVLKDTAGFVVNRISAPESLFFCMLLQTGVDSPEAVDTFAKSQALPMGPYELMDYVGIDTVVHSLEYYSKTLSRDYGKCTYYGKMIKENKLGLKTGEGFYKWENKKAIIPKIEPSEKVELMDILSLEVNEAVKLIEDGVATPEDIEIGVKLGMNRPFGPISVASGLTNNEIKEKLDKLSKKFGITVFEPAKSIREGKLREILAGKVVDKKETTVESNKTAIPEQKGENLSVIMEGKVARVEIRNGKNNLLNSGVLNELDRVIESLWNNKEVYVIVIAGAGDIFSAGAELTQFIPGGMDFIEYSRRGERLFRKLSEIPKITIAEMKGYVLGGGFELSLNCDIRVSTPETIIGFPEVTIGLLPGWTGTQRLPKLIGMSRATHYILTGERFDGNVAFNLGIVTKLFPKNDIKSKTMEFAKELSEKVSPISAALSKRLINKGSEMSMDNGLEMEAISMGVLYSTDDFKEGISAFIQKRKPEFKFK